MRSCELCEPTMQNVINYYDQTATLFDIKRRKCHISEPRMKQGLALMRSANIQNVVNLIQLFAIPVSQVF